MTTRDCLTFRFQKVSLVKQMGRIDAMHNYTGMELGCK